MKTTFTFAETSKIFAQVAKIETAVKEYNETHGKYNEVDARFDDEFAKYNYSFFKAPQELHEMFAEKLAAQKENGKAERKAYNAIKEFGELVGIGEGYTDIIEERLKRFIDSKCRWQAPEMVERVKHIALTVARRININK